MEIGLLIRYGKLVPGREQLAIDLFGDAIVYWGAKAAAGDVTYFEPFFFQTNDREEETGFFVVKGPMASIFKVMEEDDYLALTEKAYYVVEHFKVDLLTVGDGITEQLERSAKVRAELGI
ncbi:MAG TPA: hypothetical protein VGB19_11630 [Actinomycetota bacterium]